MSDIKIVQDYENAIEQAQVGESIALIHPAYSHIRIFQDGDEFSFECRSRRNGRQNFPTKGKTQWHEIKMWKTIEGAKRNALKFLE